MLKSGGEGASRTRILTSFRHAHEPILDAIERDPLPSPADLRREHGAVVPVIHTEPRKYESAIFWAQAFDRGSYGLRVAPRLFLAFVLWRPGHEANRCSIDRRLSLGDAEGSVSPSQRLQ